MYLLWSMQRINTLWRLSVPWKSIEIGRHGIAFGDTDNFDSSASFSAQISELCVTGSCEFINIPTTFFNVYTEQWKSWNSYTSHDLKYIIIHVHIWIRMRVLWFLHTSAHIYFLSLPNCVYSNLLQCALFLCTRLFCTVFYLAIYAWNLCLYIYKNMPRRLCLFGVVVTMQTWVRSQPGPCGIPCDPGTVPFSLQCVSFL
jgi:hypothetical protein